MLARMCVCKTQLLQPLSRLLCELCCYYETKQNRTKPSSFVTHCAGFLYCMNMPTFIFRKTNVTECGTPPPVVAVISIMNFLRTDYGNLVTYVYKFKKPLSLSLSLLALSSHLGNLALCT